MTPSFGRREAGGFLALDEVVRQQSAEPSTSPALSRSQQRRCVFEWSVVVPPCDHAVPDIAVLSLADQRRVAQDELPLHLWWTWTRPPATI